MCKYFSYLKIYAILYSHCFFTDTHEKPFLMPVGNLHKSANDRVTTEKVEVYETIEHPQLKENLSDILENNDIPLLITFFSPSGVKSALPYIKRYPMKTLKVG